MNPITFALRRPYTVLVTVVGVALLGGLSVFGPDKAKMKADVFPSLNLPVVYVCQPYGGMDPQQMEGLIANYYEYHFLYIGGIHHVESRNVQGVSLMKLYFHPGTDMAQALAETVGYVNRSRAFMPPGTVPPFIMRFDTGSVPVGYLVLSSETKTIAQIQDQALFRVRPMFSALPGVSAPPPFGGSARTIVVRADPQRLTAYDLSADDVVKAVAAGNTISPSGVIRETERMPLVPVNTLAVTMKDFGDIPVKAGVFLRDVVVRSPATGEPLIEDAADVPTGYALVNGRRAVYILATKRADASTLDVVQNIKDNLPKMQDALPPDIKVSFEFDQSPVVTGAVRNVGIEAVLGAILTGLMVLLFLRDWRSVIVVVVNIPLALVASLAALWLSGQTINLMTLGGLALAVGILVDEATVAVENIHTQLERTGSVALAVHRGTTETAVPRLLAMLCILAVFIPSFVMTGSARALFVPLALAVGFAMIGSYLLSSTLVPVLSAWLLKSNGHGHGRTFDALLQPAVWLTTRTRWLLVPVYLVAAGVLLYGAWLAIGKDIFPQSDTGQFQLRIKAPTGTRIEQTEELVKEALNVIKEEVGPENVDITLGYIGVVPSSYPVNSVYLWTGGPEEAVMRIAFKPRAGRIDKLTARLRDRLNDHLPKWLEQKWLGEGVPAGRAAAARTLRLSFEPADIVNEVMSFGSPTPVEVQISGTKMADNRAYAEKVRTELAKIPALKDLQYVQGQNYPTVEVAVNRERARDAGIQAGAVGTALAPATSSSRFTVPNYWREPASGISYQVQVEVPQALMKSPADVGAVPVRTHDGVPIQVQNVADVQEGVMPGQIDRYNQRRLVTLTANIQGDDLGDVAVAVSRAIEAAGAPPAGVNVDVRGQVTPFREIFRDLLYGLAASVVVIFLLLTAYFQSIRLPLVAVAAVPAVLCGVAAVLFLTGTTLNLQSFMGTIMAVGVAIANAILLVTFAERGRLNGLTPIEAAIRAARTRARPILMTSAAMTAGMIPMAIGFGEGGDGTAPL
ncbi:MAG TPA: efflux RND transporter permease subunit, partial [Gemmataceae bacterium]|nr:efflux RND transporter permease subunit [Gemmataceae bacterium]